MYWQTDGEMYNNDKDYFFKLFVTPLKLVR